MRRNDLRVTMQLRVGSKVYPMDILATLKKTILADIGIWALTQPLKTGQFVILKRLSHLEKKKYSIGCKCSSVYYIK